MKLGILPIIGRAPEKDTLNLFIKHVSIIETMRLPLKELLDASLNNKHSVVKKKIEEISLLESKADDVRRKTTLKLYSGAFLPVMRSPLYQLSLQIDNVANTIQDAGNLFRYLKDIHIPKKAIPFLKELVELADKSMLLLKKTLLDLFDNKKDFENNIQKIRETEKAADNIQMDLFDALYLEKNIKSLVLQLLIKTGHTLSEISDEVEDTGDLMVLLKILKQS